MSIQNCVELLYLGLMLRWEASAPPDRHLGILEGKAARNTQTARLVFVLRKMAAGTNGDIYRTLAVHTRRNDGHSYISDDPSWMKSPTQLEPGWYIEGCESCQQKFELIEQLRRCGVSQTFIECVKEFVAFGPIKQYMPSETEQRTLVNELENESARQIIPNFRLDGRRAGV